MVGFELRAWLSVLGGKREKGEKAKGKENRQGFLFGLLAFSPFYLFPDPAKSGGPSPAYPPYGATLSW